MTFNNNGWELFSSLLRRTNRPLRSVLHPFAILVAICLIMAPSYAQAACDCPFQGDMNGDLIYDAIDLSMLEDVVFLGAPDTQDPLCPAIRGDWNGNGFVDIVDLDLLIFQLFSGGASPVAPCLCPGSYPCDYAYTPSAFNSVVVSSQTVSAGETGVEIPIKVANSNSVKGITVPVVVREVTPGSFITTLALKYRERLNSSWEVLTSTQYDNLIGSCQGTPATGFGPPLYTDTSGHPVTGTSVGAMFATTSIFAAPLAAGADSIGSLRLIVDVTYKNGDFEIDTTCIDPSNHLLFVRNSNAAVIPEFTKGTITIEGCECPFQADMNADTFRDAVDLNGLIDVLFFGEFDPQDPFCPVTRADFNSDGFPDAVDLNDLIDHLFFGGPGPTEPCL